MDSELQATTAMAFRFPLTPKEIQRQRRVGRAALLTALGGPALILFGGIFVGIASGLVWSEAVGVTWLLSMVAAVIVGIALGFWALDLKKPRVAERQQVLDDWLMARYNLALLPKDLKRLISPRYAGHGAFMSRTIRFLDYDYNDKKALRYQNFFLTNVLGSWVLYSIEQQEEAWLAKEKEQWDFFDEFLTEVFATEQVHMFWWRDEDGDVVGAMTADPTDSTRGVALFWSDPTRLALYAPEVPVEQRSVVGAEEWYDGVLSELERSGLLLGLNWGENQRTFTVEEFKQMVSRYTS